MTETNLLIGSLSNDMFRVATLRQRGSNTAAERFLQETKRWTKPLMKAPVKVYIHDIVKNINNLTNKDLTLAVAERCLMYGILLQNYTLHNE